MQGALAQRLLAVSHHARLRRRWPPSLPHSRVELLDARAHIHLTVAQSMRHALREEKTTQSDGQTEKLANGINSIRVIHCATDRVSPPSCGWARDSPIVSSVPNCECSTTKTAFSCSAFTQTCLVLHKSRVPASEFECHWFEPAKIHA